MKNIKDKISKLRGLLRGYGGAVLAFSGGVDSSFLAKVAREEMKDRLLAVTALDEIHAPREKKDALQVAQQLALQHKVIFTNNLTNWQFAANSPERCYFCKKNLFERLFAIAKEYRLPCVLDGTNYDDRGEHRPGTLAARELGVKSPLLKAGLTKDDIRKLSQKMKLPTWNKPSQACLLTRFPYGEQITKEKLAMVRRAEEYLQFQGFKVFRVRHHGNLARLEVAPAEFEKILALLPKLSNKLNEIGYVYVTLDLKGFRSGSMDEILADKSNKQVIEGQK